MKRIISIVLSSIFALTFLASCGKTETPQNSTQPSASPAETATPETSKAPPKAVFADAGWDSIRFHNAVMMFIAENAYGMETDEIAGSTPITWTALLNGEITIESETWTDNLATYDEDIASGAIIELGLNYDDNAQGFYVPRYVIEGDPARGIEPMAPGLKTVEELKNYPDVFADPDDSSKGRIIGAISGWQVDTIMRNKYEFYGLNEMYNYVDPGSEAALAASIAGAYEKGEAIVAYYWEPTWITGKYDLVLLGDAPYDEALYPLGQCACPAVPLTVVVNKDFYAAAPEYCEFLSKYKTSSALTAEALMYIQENKAEIMDTAVWFLTQHDELLDQWLPADKADLVRAALAG